jgi:hypothetical protein
MIIKRNISLVILLISSMLSIHSAPLKYEQSNTHRYYGKYEYGYLKKQSQNILENSRIANEKITGYAKKSTASSSKDNYRWEAKIRGGGFIPRSNLFRDIYGTALGTFDGEIAASIHRYLQAWININFALAHGNSLGFCNPTTIWIVNSSLGLKAPFDINNWLTLYLGFGPTFGAIRIKDESQFTGCSSSTKSSIGFVAKSGIDFTFRTRWFVDIFADYVYQKADFEKDVNAGGLRVGAGIGVKF